LIVNYLFVQASNVQVLIAGALAGATSTLILYPLDVVRARQTVGAVKYKNIAHALERIAKDEGMGALYKGKLTLSASSDHFFLCWETSDTQLDSLLLGEFYSLTHVARKRG
jgi:hypothetical protein